MKLLLLLISINSYATSPHTMSPERLKALDRMAKKELLSEKEQEVKTCLKQLAAAKAYNKKYKLETTLATMWDGHPHSCYNMSQKELNVLGYKVEPFVYGQTPHDCLEFCRGRRITEKK